MALTIDFEDRTAGETFVFGEIFFSGGALFDVEPFQVSGGTFVSNLTAIDGFQLSGGTGNDLALNNVNVDIAVPTGITSISFLFGEYGGNINLNVNGDFRNVEDFADLDGATIGGLMLSLTTFSSELGRIDLTGSTVDLFKIGGQELWIDDIKVVPEPTTALLMGLGLAGFTFAGRRR